MASNALQIPRTDDPRLADNVSIRSQSGLFRWLVPGDKFTNPESQAARGEHAIAADARNTGSCDALVQLFRALRHSDSVAGLTSVLAAEASQLIEVDFIGVSRYDDATRTVEWHVAIPGAEVESGTIETTAAETITEWVYQNQLPLVIPALDCQTRLQSKILQRLP